MKKNRIESPMYWTYNSIESILEELHDIHFRGVKLSESLLLAKRFNLVLSSNDM